MLLVMIKEMYVIFAIRNRHDVTSMHILPDNLSGENVTYP